MNPTVADTDGGRLKEEAGFLLGIKQWALQPPRHSSRFGHQSDTSLPCILGSEDKRRLMGFYKLSLIKN